MRQAARRTLARALYEAGTLVAERPALALPIARWRGHGVVIDERTDIVIEGYPRSGNSFAVAAFTGAQPGPVRVAHHLHAPAHVIAAARAGVPALVVIRDPEEAVVEFVAVKPDLSVGQAVRGYVRFYRPLVPHRNRFVVARFEEVTADLGAVIRRVNERFGTSFAEPAHDEDAVKASREGIDRYWEGREGPGLPVIGRTAAGKTDRPSRETLLARYRDPKLSGLRARARSLFEELATRPP